MNLKLQVIPSQGEGTWTVKIDAGGRDIVRTASSLASLAEKLDREFKICWDKEMENTLREGRTVIAEKFEVDDPAPFLNAPLTESLES